MARSRPVSKFKNYTHQALCDWSKGVTLALTGNLTFPTPPVSLVAQGAANDAFQAAILAWGPVGNRGLQSATRNADRRPQSGGGADPQLRGIR